MNQFSLYKLYTRELFTKPLQQPTVSWLEYILNIAENRAKKRGKRTNFHLISNKKNQNEKRACNKGAESLKLSKSLLSYYMRRIAFILNLFFLNCKQLVSMPNGRTYKKECKENK